MVLNSTICKCEAIQRESRSYLAMIICMACLRQSTNAKTWNLKLAFSKKAKRSNLGANIDQLIEMTKITSVHNVKHPKTCQKKGGKKH